MQAGGSLGSTLRFLGVGLAIVAVVACQDPGEDCAAACPEPVDGWESRQLTVDEMRAILADWTPERAVAAFAACVPGGYSDLVCPDVPVGVDPRVGLPVYLRWHCDDVCPEYAKFLIAYGPEYFGNEDCEEIGMCYVQGGASPGTHLECLPFFIYYGGCHSAEWCDWDGVCEPESQESPSHCPRECLACGDGLEDAPVEERLAAGVNVFVDPAALPDGSYCIYGDLYRQRNLIPELGAFYARVLGGYDVQAEAQRLVEDGRFPLLFRAQAVNLEAGAYATLRVAKANALAGPPRFDGTDLVAWPVPVAELPLMCGEINADWVSFRFDGTAAVQPPPMPVRGLADVALPVEFGRFLGSRDASAWYDVEVRVWVPSAATRDLLAVAVAAHLNAGIDASPLGPEAASLAATLDGQCDPAVCPGESPGVGECAASSPPSISATEVLCHAGFHGLFTDSAEPGAPLTDLVCYQYLVTRAVPVITTEGP